MEERALRRSFAWFIVLVLPLILILGVLPCAAEEIYTLQKLVDGESIPIDNLELSDFSIPPSLDLSNFDLSNISVKTKGEGTLKPGLEFVLNGELSVTASSRTLIISYTVTHLGGYFIEGDSFTLDPITISGNNALVRFLVETAYGQNGITKKIFYQLNQNQSTQFSDGKLETPQAVLRPTVSLQAIAPASEEEASIDGLEQRFTLATAPGTPIANAGTDLIVADVAQLDGSESTDPEGEELQYFWDLKHREISDYNQTAAGPSPEVSGLEAGFYDVELTVTDIDGLSATDTMVLAASGPGPSGAGTEPKIEQLRSICGILSLKNTSTAVGQLPACLAPLIYLMVSSSSGEMT